MQNVVRDSEQTVDFLQRKNSRWMENAACRRAQEDGPVIIIVASKSCPQPVKSTNAHACMQSKIKLLYRCDM